MINKCQLLKYARKKLGFFKFGLSTNINWNVSVFACLSSIAGCPAGPMAVKLKGNMSPGLE